MSIRPEAPDHFCSEKENIAKNQETIIAVAANVSAITTSVQALVNQVAQLTKLFERSATSENEIKNIRQEQVAQWKRIDETVKDLRNIAGSVRDTIKTVEHLQKDLNDGLRVVKDDLVEAKKRTKDIEKEIQTLKITPGKVALDYLKIITTAIIVALVTLYIRGGGGT